MTATRRAKAPDWYTAEMQAEDKALAGAWWRCERHGAQDPNDVIHVGDQTYCTGDECTTPLFLVKSAMRVPDEMNSWKGGSTNFLGPKKRRAAPVDQVDDEDPGAGPEGDVPESSDDADPDEDVDEVDQVGEIESATDAPTDPTEPEPAEPVLAPALTREPPPRSVRRKRNNPRVPPPAPARSSSAAVLAVSRQPGRCAVCEVQILSPIPYVRVEEEGVSGRACLSCADEADDELRALAKQGRRIVVERRR